MQFKRLGNRVQVLAYRGYDREKRRARVELLGSFHAITGELGDKLKNNLTEDEKKEVQAYIENKRQAEKQAYCQHRAECIALNVRQVAESITAGDFKPTEEWAASVWTAIDVLGRALRRAGYPRPPKPKKPKTGPDGGGVGVLPGQLDLPSA